MACTLFPVLERIYLPGPFVEGRFFYSRTKGCRYPLIEAAPLRINLLLRELRTSTCISVSTPVSVIYIWVYVHQHGPSSIPG